jgi:hypothetical protein
MKKKNELKERNDREILRGKKWKSKKGNSKTRASKKRTEKDKQIKSQEATKSNFEIILFSEV